MSPFPATVFLVDDDASVLKALSRLLRSAGWATATFQSSEEFLQQFDPAAPGCLVLDLSMPELDGLELQRRLLGMGGRLPIVFLTGRGDIRSSVRAMKAGAVDFLTKPVSDGDLLKAVVQAVELDGRSRKERAETSVLEERLATLTSREREVLVLVVGGRLNKQIAGQLGTVEKTIKVHRGRVMKKLGANSLAELVRQAARCGITPP